MGVKMFKNKKGMALMYLAIALAVIVMFATIFPPFKNTLMEILNSIF